MGKLTRGILAESLKAKEEVPSDTVTEDTEAQEGTEAVMNAPQQPVSETAAAVQVVENTDPQEHKEPVAEVLQERGNETDEELENR